MEACKDLVDRCFCPDGRPPDEAGRTGGGDRGEAAISTASASPAGARMKRLSVRERVRPLQTERVEVDSRESIGGSCARRAHLRN